jgi:phage N-6-adenine-methyltransferase
MKGQKTLFSKAANDWETPQNLFDIVNGVWGYEFTFDAAADERNFKVAHWSGDSLEIPWEGRVWVNPPYNLAKEFVSKAWKEVREGRVELVTLLLPARTDTRMWHEVIALFAEEIIFLKGRLKFGGSTNSAPFPSALVTFRRGKMGPPRVMWEDLR